MLTTIACKGGIANSPLLKTLKSSIVVAQHYQTCARCASATKTPIQEWGWEYLQRQRALHRPISPHLSIYQPQLTWYVSGLHRITGCVMAGVLLFGSVGFAVLPFDFTAFVEFVRSLGLPSVVTATFKFIIAWPLIFHSLNGCRFLGFDLAKGTDIKSVYRSGYLVLFVSTVLALAVTIAARREDAKKVTAK